MFFKKLREILYEGSSGISLGLDIGSHTIKAVFLKKSQHDIKLLSHDIVELPGFGQDFKGLDVPQTVGKILMGRDLDRVRLITSLGGSGAVVRQIPFLSISSRELESSLAWEARSHIPFPMDEVELKSQILFRNQDANKMEVLLVAVTKKALEEHLMLIGQLDLKPKVIDVNSLALVNCLLAGGVGNENSALVSLDIGATHTTISIFQEDFYYFTRDLALAGNDFTRELQEKKHINFSRAEELKKTGDIDVSFFGSTLDRLVSEVRQSLLYFDKKTGAAGFNKIYLSGGGAKMKGLPDALTDRLSLPVAVVSRFDNILPEGDYGLNESLDTSFPQLILAMGLALRGI